MSKIIHIKHRVDKNAALKAEFGRIALLKIICPKCGLISIVRDGITLCCDVNINKPERYKTKRESEGEAKRPSIRAKTRKRILEIQAYRCIYCGKKFGESIFNHKRQAWTILGSYFDHAISWKFSRDSSSKNIVASCQICNRIKSDLLFETLEQARRYIVHRRQIKGYVDELPGVPQEI